MTGSKGDSLKWSAGDKTPDDVYITRVLNYGTWQEWEELKKNCSPARIKKVLRHPRRGEWTAHGKAFAETIFDITLPDDVLISYDV